MCKNFVPTQAQKPVKSKPFSHKAFALMPIPHHFHVISFAKIDFRAAISLRNITIVIFWGNFSVVQPPDRSPGFYNANSPAPQCCATLTNSSSALKKTKKQTCGSPGHVWTRWERARAADFTFSFLFLQTCAVEKTARAKNHDGIKAPTDGKLTKWTGSRIEKTVSSEI